MGELLRIYPFRYIDRSRFWRISEIAGEEAYIQIKARVVSRTLYGPSGAVIPPGDKKRALWNSFLDYPEDTS